MKALLILPSHVKDSFDEVEVRFDKRMPRSNNEADKAIFATGLFVDENDLVINVVQVLSMPDEANA